MKRVKKRKRKSLPAKKKQPIEEKRRPMLHPRLTKLQHLENMIGSLNKRLADIERLAPALQTMNRLFEAKK